jgi:hypothetical protein
VYGIKSPGNKCCILRFNSLTSTFFAAKIAPSASYSWFVYCLCTLINIWSMRASCESMIVQKLVGNCMHPVSSVVTFPLPIFDNCFENLPHTAFFDWIASIEIVRSLSLHTCQPWIFDKAHVIVE